MSNNTPPTQCPICGGKMINKKGVSLDGNPYDFWGCSNFKSKGCTYSWNKSRTKTEQPKPITGEELILKKLDEIIEKLNSFE